MAKRTAYLKLQRDKLLAMKKAEREKQLADAEASQGKTRPKVETLQQFSRNFAFGKTLIHFIAINSQIHCQSYSF